VVGHRGPLVGFIWALIMDRVIGATNRYLDAHALLWIKPVVASIWGSPLIHPVVVGFILFLLAVFGLVIHAYVESRDSRRANHFRVQPSDEQPDDPISRAIKLRDHTITLATELTTLLYRHGYPLEGTTDPDDSFESIPTDEGLRGEIGPETQERDAVVNKRVFPIRNVKRARHGRSNSKETWGAFGVGCL